MPLLMMKAALAVGAAGYGLKKAADKSGMFNGITGQGNGADAAEVESPAEREGGMFPMLSALMGGSAQEEESVVPVEQEPTLTPYQQAVRAFDAGNHEELSAAFDSMKPAGRHVLSKNRPEIIEALVGAGNSHAQAMVQEQDGHADSSEPEPTLTPYQQALRAFEAGDHGALSTAFDNMKPRGRMGIFLKRPEIFETLVKIENSHALTMVRERAERDAAAKAEAEVDLSHMHDGPAQEAIGAHRNIHEVIDPEEQDLSHMHDGPAPEAAGWGRRHYE